MRVAIGVAIGFFVTTAAHASVTSANVNCRAEPSVESAAVERIPSGEQVFVVERQADWAQLNRERQCWVSARYLREQGSSVTGWNSASPRYTGSETRRANRRSLRASRAFASTPRRVRSVPLYNTSCPCSGSHVCIGPRGGRYCITSGGNKRYGV